MVVAFLSSFADGLHVCKLILHLLYVVSRYLLQDTEPEVNADVDFSAPSTYRILNGEEGYNHTTETFDCRRKLLGVHIVELSLVETSCIFPNESGRSFLPGEKYMIWLTVKNNWVSRMLMIATLGRIYLPHDLDNPVQKLTPKVGKYELVGTLLYVMDFNYTPRTTTFYNGTIKIVESRVILLVKTTAVYITLGAVLLVFLWWGCSRELFHKWEEIMQATATIVQEEAVEEHHSVAQSSSKKKKKSKKK